MVSPLKKFIIDWILYLCFGLFSDRKTHQSGVGLRVCLATTLCQICDLNYVYVILDHCWFVFFFSILVYRDNDYFSLHFLAFVSTCTCIFVDYWRLMTIIWLCINRFELNNNYSKAILYTVYTFWSPRFIHWIVARMNC